jgi:hypothetical protein
MEAAIPEEASFGYAGMGQSYKTTTQKRVDRLTDFGQPVDRMTALANTHLCDHRRSRRFGVAISS